MGRVAALEALVRGRAALGDHAGAAATLRELEALTVGTLMPALRATASFSEGIVAVATGDYDAATRRFEDAADLFARGGAPYEAARSRLELASVLSGMGRIDAAKEEATAALAAFRRLGAERETERAEALARRLARAGDGRSSDAGSVAALTARKVEVLRMVAQGLSDKEMAVALGLSEHTIHRHVSNVLTKLGLPSRAAAVAHAARRGLL